jgi:alpha-tubulin suppressor-like RCC1 family protein
MLRGLGATVLLAVGGWLAACGEGPMEPLPAPFTYISAGILHTCGLVGDGIAYCWGYNERGQLGDGSRSTRTTPVRVLGTVKYGIVSAGGQHTCGLSGGKIYCWGLNLSGQLGDGTSRDRATPGTISSTVSFTSVDAGATTSCALTAEGRAYCWGRNSDGQVGDGTFVDRATPVEVTGGLAFRVIRVGAFHTCGLTAAAEAYCWGRNDSGQLGNNGTDDSPVPVRVATTEAFVDIDVGFRHTCALTADGRAFCWGRNDFGQLGLGEEASGRIQTTPVPLPATLRFRSITTGAVFTCALEKESGAAYCWGYNGSGQLGALSRDRCVDEAGNVYPCQFDPLAVSGGLQFSIISAATQHVCAITLDGVAYCWGLGSEGQLGDGSKGETVFKVEPTKVAGQP